MEQLANKTNLLGMLEAVLFTYGEPMPIERIAKILSAEGGAGVLTAGRVEELVSLLRAELQKDGRGLSLILRDGRLQLVTKPDFHAAIEGIVKEELSDTLTPAALETIAIIAYGGSLPRSTVDYVRGVNSSFIIRNLLLRGLLDRAPDPERSNAYRYQPSFNLLRHLGVSSAEELPDHAKFREAITKLIPER